MRQMKTFDYVEIQYLFWFWTIVWFEIYLWKYLKHLRTVTLFLFFCFFLNLSELSFIKVIHIFNKKRGFVKILGASNTIFEKKIRPDMIWCFMFVIKKKSKFEQFAENQGCEAQSRWRSFVSKIPLYSLVLFFNQIYKKNQTYIF